MNTRDSWIATVLIASVVIAALLMMSNPRIMESIDNLVFQQVMAFLRALDKFTVDYQVMRGVWRDASSTSPETKPE